VSDVGFPVEMVHGVPVVTTPEAVDITNAGALGSALARAAPDGHGTIVVDMGRTEFCDTAGLHTLVAAYKHGLAAGGQVLLVTRATAVLRIFAITGLDRVIPHFTSLEQALTDLRARSLEVAGGRLG
jgi:anti-sigma B factor antagonist